MAPRRWERLRQRVRLRTRLRHWARRLNPRRARLPRALVNGFPKAGTHLLTRCVTLLPGMVPEGTWVPLELMRRLGWLAVARETPTAERPEEALEEFDRMLQSLAGGEFLLGHLRYHRAIGGLLEARGVRSLLILRDPRDVVVSLTYHIVSRSDHQHHEYFTRTLKSDDERLLACIGGIKGKGAVDESAGIGKRLGYFLPWLQVSTNYTARFERLVGSQGGGSADVQREEIGNIARHLGVSLVPEEIERVAFRLFGQGSLTFRRGQVGSWKEHFKEEHKQAFKRVAGRELIELGYERDLNW